jgi:hypothetical protein
MSNFIPGMKKILLAGGLFSFISAIGQQDDFFDIENHLEKKSGEKRYRSFNRLYPDRPNNPIFQSLNRSSQSMATLSHILPNGDKVYLLPMGGMPCIVPDMKQFNMPLAGNKGDYLQSLPGKAPQAGRIPNAITPYRMIPEN